MKKFLGVSTLALCCALFSGKASAISLNEAVSIAVQTSPEVGQAVENREAVEFELRQARGLYLPSVDLEAFGGGRRLASPTRTSVGFLGTGLSPAQASLVVTQSLYQSGARRAEIERQASRVDGASFRVLERSSSIGLQVVEQYLEYLLQLQIRKGALANLSFHRRISGDIESAISGGTLTEADRQQVKERLFAAEARLKEAEEAASAASINFFRLVGQPLKSAQRPTPARKVIPASLTGAIALGKQKNSRIRAAKADVDASDADVRAARAQRGPQILAEARSRIGFDVDGSDGRTSDIEGRLVARWNLYRGGIDRANEQEQVRRASEQRLVLAQAYREVEAAVRISWDRRNRQVDLARTLRQQARENASLVNSYERQFGVGRRSLLDVLDAQNTRFNSDVLSTSANFAALFSEYQLLAATGQLLHSLGVEHPVQAEAYGRIEFRVRETQDADVYYREDSRQINELPLDLLAPFRKKN
ncbi:MAG: TolC family protein [Pseudomonadota bacterium]